MTQLHRSVTAKNTAKQAENEAARLFAIAGLSYALVTMFLPLAVSARYTAMTMIFFLLSVSFFIIISIVITIINVVLHSVTSALPANAAAAAIFGVYWSLVAVFYLCRVRQSVLSSYCIYYSQERGFYLKHTLNDRAPVSNDATYATMHTRLWNVKRFVFSLPLNSNVTYSMRTSTFDLHDFQSNQRL